MRRGRGRQKGASKGTLYGRVEKPVADTIVQGMRLPDEPAASIVRGMLSSKEAGSKELAAPPNSTGVPGACKAAQPLPAITSSWSLVPFETSAVQITRN